MDCGDRIEARQREDKTIVKGLRERAGESDELKKCGIEAVCGD
jgi:hypothetical protein